MEFHKLPSVYKEELEQQKENAIQAAKSNNETALKELNSQKGKRPRLWDYFSGMGTIGFAIGFFICCINCDAETAGPILGPLIGGTVIGLIIGYMNFKVAKGKYESKITDIDNQISKSNDALEKNIAKIIHDTDHTYLEYLSAFEKKEQDESVRMAESEVAKEVSAWIAGGFCRTIDAADRSPHVERINIPFVFHIYKDKIACNLGTFDFKIKRYSELQDAVQQAALAKVIASGIQLDLMMDYPKDASGTDIAIAINYSYPDNCVTVSMSYVAPNGNYQSVKNW